MEELIMNDLAVWVPFNPRQKRSSKFVCSWCGGVAYYPQNHHIKERSGCPYRYCPRCGHIMKCTLEDKGEN